MQKVIAIVGATATGKTGASIRLAKAVNGEIISADSRQVYRGLDIGTGKVTREEMEGVPHHLLDVADPRDAFSAAGYMKLARVAIDDIATRERVPIIVGGTGFYVDALFGSVSLPDVPPDPALRKELATRTTEELSAELARLDPRRAQAIDAKNPVRLVRALEIARALGSVPEQKGEDRYDVLWIGLALPKEALAEKIHTRLVSRLDAGMLDEARALHAEGLSFERMEELGLEYRYMARYLEGALPYEKMASELETEIRGYARRQATWFRRNKDIRWFEPADAAGILHTAERFLANR